MPTQLLTATQRVDVEYRLAASRIDYIDCEGCGTSFHCEYGFSDAIGHDGRITLDLDGRSYTTDYSLVCVDCGRRAKGWLD